jgi:hypothetical protein
MSLQPRVRPRSFELLAKGQRYSWASITAPEARYTADIVEHTIRYAWPKVLSLYRENEEILCIYCDITSAVQKLPTLERTAVTLMLQGYEIRDTETGIAPKMGIEPDVAAKILKRAYKMMSGFLGDGK